MVHGTIEIFNSRVNKRYELPWVFILLTIQLVTVSFGISPPSHAFLGWIIFFDSTTVWSFNSRVPPSPRVLHVEYLGLAVSDRRGGQQCSITHITGLNSTSDCKYICDRRLLVSIHVQNRGCWQGIPPTRSFALWGELETVLGL